MDGIVAIGAAKSGAIKASKAYTDTAIQALAGGLKYKGSVPTVADLPAAAESNKGWMYTIAANGHEFVSDGAQWIDLSADQWRGEPFNPSATSFEQKVFYYTVEA